MTPINDLQLSRQKNRQKISVIKTNTFDWELLNFDDIKKRVNFGILFHVLSSKKSICKGGFVFVMITEIF